MGRWLQYRPSQASSGTQCTAVSAGVPALPAAKLEDGPTIAPNVLVADFDGWMSEMRLLNPDLSIRVNMPALKSEAARIREELTKPMTRREAWLHFAKLNPYLWDAHGGIQMPDYRNALEAHIKAGGRVVPVEVRFAKDGSLRVFAVASGANSIKQGDRVLSINGYGADRMIADMMSLAIGDTTGFQRAFVERRFAMLFWYLYGDTGQYDVVVRLRNRNAHARSERQAERSCPKHCNRIPTRMYYSTGASSAAISAICGSMPSIPI